MVGNYIKTRSLLQLLQAYITSLDFLKALSVLVFLILLINQELKILTPFKIFTVLINLKTLFLNKLFISLYQNSVNSSRVYLEVIILDFVRVLLMNINISIIFCQSLVGSRYICFNFWRGVLATDSLAGSLAGSSVGFLAGFLAGFLVGSLASSSVGLDYRYSFTAMVLKSVGLLGNYTLYISPLILSNLNRLVHLPLYLVLLFCYISISKLKGRL